MSYPDPNKTYVPQIVPSFSIGYNRNGGIYSISPDGDHKLIGTFDKNGKVYDLPEDPKELKALMEEKEATREPKSCNNLLRFTEIR